MNQKIKDNISVIIEVIEEAEKFNGYQRSPSANVQIHQLKSRLISLSDGEVDLYFETMNNTNPRLGAYKITLKCTEEVEEYINQIRDDMHED